MYRYSPMTCTRTTIKNGMENKWESMVHPVHGWTTGSWNNTDETQKHNVERKNPEMKSHIPSDYIFIKLINITTVVCC